MTAFVVTVPIDDIDLASDALWQLGVRAIEERPTAAESGTVDLWTAVGEDPDAIARARRQLAGRWRCRVVDVDDVVAETWREFAGPMWVDDGLVLVPAWQHHHVVDSVVAVSVEPGGAFGFGDHPTTLLSLRAMRRSGVDGRLGGRTVLDVGCGTGVVSIIAARLGAAEVRAVDIASAAVESTVANARRNGVGGLVVADTTAVGDLDGSYDLVVANILAPTLIRLAADLRRLTGPSGLLVISGVLADAHTHVLDALDPMEARRTDSLDGWAAVTLGHATESAQRMVREQGLDLGEPGE